MKPKDKTKLYRLSEKGVKRIRPAWLSPEIIKQINLENRLIPISQEQRNILRKILVFKRISTYTRGRELVTDVKCVSNSNQWCWSLYMDDLEECTDNTSYEIEWV